MSAEVQKKSKVSARMQVIKRWSPIWIIPILTAFIGAWIIVSYFAQQGKSFTLYAKNADGIVAGKTTIKNRNVDVGVIESVTLSDDYSQVIMKAKLKRGMEKLLKVDTAFWLVKPRIGTDGVSGLGTLLSGVYITLAQGTKTEDNTYSYQLLDTPPLSSPTEQGLRLSILSKENGVIPSGSSVLFRGVKVGNVEQSTFDADKREVRYELFIPKPYDILVTTNVRFWKESGFDLRVSPQGINANITSLDSLVNGGISFDVPEGALLGEPVKDNSEYTLYADKASTQNSQYTDYREYLLFFKDSIAGLSAGSSVEYRGIRVGTVTQAPLFDKHTVDFSEYQFDIPVLIRLEAGRLDKEDINRGFTLIDELIAQQKNGLRASLKSANIITGALMVDLDFHGKIVNEDKPKSVEGYQTIRTVSAGLSQIQSKIMAALDKVNNLPIESSIAEVNRILKESTQLVNSINKTASSKEVQRLPKDLQNTLDSLQQTLKTLQPGSDMHRTLMTSMQEIDKSLRELKPLLQTLNEKSNALVIEARVDKDPTPKAANRQDKK